jgi:hypothetical protein
MQLHGIRVARIVQTLPAFDYYLTFALTLPELHHLESVLATAKEHLKDSPHSPDAVVTFTLQANMYGPGEPVQSQESSAQFLDSLHKLVAIAKTYLHEHSGEHTVELLPFLEEISEGQRQLTENIISGLRIFQRVICLVDNHRICLAFAHVEAGDVIVVFRGGPSLHVLRPSGDSFQYSGDAYMYGLMEGEATEKDGWETLVEEFSVV